MKTEGKNMVKIVLENSLFLCQCQRWLPAAVYILKVFEIIRVSILFSDEYYEY